MRFNGCLPAIILFALAGPLAPARAQQPPPALPVAPPSLFSDDERAALVAYWAEPGRYTATAPPEAATAGPWQVRLTPEGSVWLLGYQKAVAAGVRLPPSVDARAAAGTPQEQWEAWVTARLARDRWDAARAADAANRIVLPNLPPPAAAAAAPPPAPGPIPPSLLGACGNPPPLAYVVTPLVHSVRLDDETYAYPDNVRLRERYAYYRFPRGTVAYGPALRDMPDAELAGLFADAGYSPSEARVARAVSRLEGGFETVNTYDTGFVSIGFIQFVTLSTGKESLSEVLMQQKYADPEAYRRDFRRFGIDVAGDFTLTVVDPATGAELAGNAAVLKVVEDKRLTAVFQRAGRHSRAFRVAQIKIARQHYWPMYDPLSVTLTDGTKVEGRVIDVVRSEAGMATLFDRKVNRGSIAPFAETVAQVMAEKGLKTLEQARAHEREIVTRMKYRADFLADPALGQPE